MFDAEYFTKHIGDQINELGVATVDLYLHSGTSFRIRGIGTATNGCLMLEVYPDEGMTGEAQAERRKTGGTDEVFFDRVAIAYESISYVRLTVKDPAEGGMGFRSK